MTSGCAMQWAFGSEALRRSMLPQHGWLPGKDIFPGVQMTAGMGTKQVDGNAMKKISVGGPAR